MRVNEGTPSSVIHLTLISVLICSLLSFVATPANAIALPECTPEISSSGGYTIVKFVDAGECNWTSPTGSTVMRGLIVAGGGGGGGNSHMGGGGGGGGYVSFETLTVENEVLKIKVGVGGNGGASTVGGVFPQNGETSSIIVGTDASPTLRLVAPGGGTGGSDLEDRSPGREYLAKNGGSGGGSGGGYFPAKNPGISETVTAVIPNTQTALSIGLLQLGNSGSTCDHSPYGGRGGGGGGAGAPGGCYVDTANGATENAGHGGNGYANNILGTQYFWAGGGGGGHFGYQTNIYGAGNGGLGGGGGGGAFGEQVSPQPRQGSGGAQSFKPASPAIAGAGGNGGDNTGGGGGAGIHPSGSGGAGGSGIVVFRYASTDTSWLAVTRQSAGVQRLATFTTQPQITFQSGVNDETDTAKSSVLVTATISSGGTIVGGGTATATAGVADFNNLRVDGVPGNTYRITYSAPGSAPVTETITLAGLAVTRQSAGVNRLEVFSTQPQITFMSGGTDSSETSTRSFIVTATISTGATIVGGDTATASAGVATFSNLRIDGTVGSTYTITYNSASKTLATETVTLSGTDTPFYDGTSGIVACGRSGYLTITNNSVSGGYWCQGSANIPSGVTSIGDGALSDENGSSAASQITSLTIPDSVTYFGWAAFARTDLMTSLSLGNGISGFGQYSFSNVSSLTSLVIPANVTSISEGNFSFAQNLASLTMPSGITSIHANSFSQIQPGTPFIYCGSLPISFPGPIVLTPTCPDGTPATAISTQPTGAANGATLAIQPVVRIVDSATSTITSSTLKVVASIKSGTGSLSGTTTVSAVNGVATFTNLVITGTPGPFTLAFTPVGVSIPITSEMLTISTGSALTPTFDSPTVTADGFSVQISNYNNAFTWSGTATASGSVAINGSGLVTVTGVAPGTTSTATINTTQTDYASGSATVSGLSMSNIATLSALTLSAGTLSPIFSSSTTSYTASVLSSTSSIKITPTRTQGNATITVNSTTVTSGTASGDISLSEGVNTITVVGTAQDGTTTSTYTITVTRPAPPTITISTTDFQPRASTNVGVNLSNFDTSLNYQATIKFVDVTTNTDVSNGTLSATKGGTSLIPGYSSYSATKLGFKGTYAQVAASLASLTWNPATGSGNISMRIGIASMPGTNEFYYDANSGHYYKYVSSALPWVSARTASEATTLFGLRGYLAEVNSAAENNFIGRETTATNIWIGASDRTVEGTWIWDGATATYPKPTGSGTNSGRSATFHSWANGEPNDWPWHAPSRPEREDCAVTNWQGKIGMWNDWPCLISQGYLIEFGGRPGETSTTIGATLTTVVNAVPPVQYTITYDPLGGNETPTAPSRTTGEKIALAGAITKATSGGITYQFAGWNAGSTLYKAGETFTVGSANLTFSAEWAQLYQVTYTANGGSFSGGETLNDAECTAGANRCTDGQTIKLNSAPTRAGYTFADWKNQSGTSVVDIDNAVAGIQTAITSTNYIFSATWTPITYTVTYTSSGSSVPTQSELEEGETFTVGTAGTRAGFEFNGWSDGDSTYFPGSDIIVGTSNISLTAQWTAVFSVTYSPGLGTGTPSTDTVSYPGAYDLVIATDAGISRSGFTFNGWSDGITTYQSGEIYTIATNNITLTAQWSAVPVTQAPAPTPTLTPTVNPRTVEMIAAETAAAAAVKLARDTLQITVAKNQKTYQEIFASVTTSNSSTSTLVAEKKSGAVVNTRSVSINSSQSANFRVAARNISLSNDVIEEFKSRVSITVTTTGISVTPVSGFTGVLIVPFAATVDGVETVVLNQIVVNPAPPVAQDFAPTSINRSSIAWTPSTSQTTGYLVKVNGKEICQTTANSCPVAQLIGPKSVVTIVALGNDKTVSTQIVIPYVATRPIPALKVNFAVGSSVLSREQKIEIRSVARVIDTQGFTRLVVSGFTDSSGSSGLNKALSEARAKSVAAFMRTLLPKVAIKASAFGPKKPLASNSSETGKAQNRRTEIATW